MIARGSRGTLVVTAESAEHIPAIRLDEPVDPTGAPDTFWVAYLVARSNRRLAGRSRVYGVGDDGGHPCFDLDRRLTDRA